MRIMKFGGSSLGSYQGFVSVVELVSEAWEEEAVVVVVSALAGVTQELARMVSERGTPCKPSSDEGWSGDVKEGSGDAILALQNRHLELWKEVVESQPGKVGGLEDALTDRKIRKVLEELRILRWVARAHGSWTPASRDRALGVGERLATLLVAGALRVRGVPGRPVDAETVIRTDSVFGDARVSVGETRRLAQEVLGKGARTEIQVVPGFVGADGEGRATTLGWGASDLTATVLAEALSARLVEIWTDVDGVHAEDPRVNPQAPLLPFLDYREARAMALAGARVLHPKTLDPIEGPGIPLRVRNTFDPGGAGTLVYTDSGAGHRSTGGELVPSGPLPVNLVLAGATGGVGRAVLAQLEAVAPRLLREEGVELRVAGLASSRTQAWFPGGLPFSEHGRGLGGSSLGHGLGIRGFPDPLLQESSPDWEEIVARLVQNPPANPIFLDCTASSRVAEAYLPLLEAGIPVVTPNKLGVSGELSTYLRLQEAVRATGAPFRYETTAGAALPVIRTLRDLKDSGDGIRRIEGVLSGTLSFVFHRLGRKVRFSEAVREAREKGYTEPHPGEDLSGADVGRKLLILCREGGFALEPGQIQVESLVPPELSEEKDPDAFLAGLEAYDAQWAQRVAEIEGQGSLAYVARFRGEGGEVGVRTLPPGDCLGGLRPTENRVVVQTDRNLEVPLAISGPGAGWEVTASGVLTDLLATCRECYSGKAVRRVRGWGDPGGGPRGKRRVA